VVVNDIPPRRHHGHDVQNPRAESKKSTPDPALLKVPARGRAAYGFPRYVSPDMPECKMKTGPHTYFYRLLPSANNSPTTSSTVGITLDS